MAEHEVKIGDKDVIRHQLERSSMDAEEVIKIMMENLPGEVRVPILLGTMLPSDRLSDPLGWSSNVFIRDDSLYATVEFVPSTPEQDVLDTAEFYACVMFDHTDKATGEVNRCKLMSIGIKPVTTRPWIEGLEEFRAEPE